MSVEHVAKLVAEAVKDALNSGTFSQTFTAIRAYRPLFDLPEMKDLHVTVVPKDVVESMASRHSVQQDVRVDVAVQQKVTSDAEADVLMGLVQEIAQFVRFTRLTTMPSAAWLETENSPIYAPEHLEKLSQFTSVLTVTYRLFAREGAGGES